MNPAHDIADPDHVASDLVSQAEGDSRTAAHVGVAADGYRITPAFLHAAASADIVRRVDGSFGYDLDSVAGRLVH